MIKKFIKSVIGDKNAKRLRRVQQVFRAARNSWRISGYGQQGTDRMIVSSLLAAHSLEKNMVVNNGKAPDKYNYTSLIENTSRIIQAGISPADFSVCESVAVIKSALNSLTGHESEKSRLEELITKYNIPQNYRGGIERLSSSEIFAHNNFDFHGFISSRHSIRKFTDKIIPREIIYDIVRDAQFYPSICNRQPCKVYFSDSETGAAKLASYIPDQFIARGRIHNAFIVTCDRALLSPAELNDQEYLNGGIFLAYLVMSIHAHNLGSCLCQYLQVYSNQYKIKREFGIKASEVIIGFVGFGELEDEAVCACAQRRPIETVAVKIDA